MVSASAGRIWNPIDPKAKLPSGMVSATYSAAMMPALHSCLVGNFFIFSYLGCF